GFAFCVFAGGEVAGPQKSMPPMPPPGGMPPPPPPEFFFGSSATMASVVIRSAATEAAFWIAARTTLVGSMMPLETRLPYSPVWWSSFAVLIRLAVRRRGVRQRRRPERGGRQATG